MLKIFQYLIDYIFPPKDEELIIRNFDINWLILNGERAKNTEFPFINAIYSYKNHIIKELIWQIKYKKNTHAIKCAAYSLYNELNDKYNNALLIPIPISKSRRKERGYNQCELLINGIINFDKENKFSKDFDLLIREKDIEKQTHKNREERISNTKHIFTVQKDIDPNTQIIIIDDVTTTGSTLNEARDELIRANYTKIKALTIAH